jgi:hypothetical protein
MPILNQGTGLLTAPAEDYTHYSKAGEDAEGIRRKEKEMTNNVRLFVGNRSGKS